MTTWGGSSLPKTAAARPASGTERRMIPAVKREKRLAVPTAGSRSRTRATAPSVPAVPGAQGTRPSPKKVEKNLHVLSGKFTSLLQPVRGPGTREAGSFDLEVQVYHLCVARCQKRYARQIGKEERQDLDRPEEEISRKDRECARSAVSNGHRSYQLSLPWRASPCSGSPPPVSARRASRDTSNDPPMLKRLPAL